MLRMNEIIESSDSVNKVKVLENYYSNRTITDEKKLNLAYEIIHFLESQLVVEGYDGRIYPSIADGIISTESSPLKIDNTGILTTTNSRNLILDVFCSSHRKLFEISKQFRNDPDDITHKKSFVQLTFVARPSFYEDVIKYTERTLIGLMQTIRMKHRELIDPRVDDWIEKSWNRITFHEALEKYLNVNVRNIEEIEKKQLESWLNEIILHIDMPTFITEYPIKLGSYASPLLHNRFVKQRSELFWPSGIEVANIWCVGNLVGIDEINNMLRRAEEFSFGEKKIGADILTLFELGIGACTIGIERLAMVLTKSRTIGEVIVM